MTQDAVVTKVFPNGMAEVAVSRGTACGSNCGNCESCVFQNEIKAFAKNSVHARPGEKVVIESLSSRRKNDQKHDRLRQRQGHCRGH